MKRLNFIILMVLFTLMLGSVGYASGVEAPTATPGQSTYATSSLQVTLSTLTSGASIYYTTDDSDPTASSTRTLYSGSVLLNGPTMLKAVAFSDGQYSSVSSFIFNKVVTPYANISGGEYNLPQTITLSTPSIGAQIYYTTDDSIPSLTNGNPYQGPLTIDKSMTLKAITVLNEVQSYRLSSDHNYSSNSNKSWAISAPNGAQRMRVHFVRISTEQNHDFVTTSSGNTWSGDVNKVWSSWSTGNTMTVSLSSDSTTNGYGFDIDMIEFDTGSPYISSEGKFIYKIYNIYPPQANLQSGTYSNAINVGLSTQGTGDIYYTIDGSNPSDLTKSQKYSSPININSNITLKAITYNSALDRFSDEAAVYNYTISSSALTAPTASPAQGIYVNIPNITLTASESAIIYYTTNGSTPTTSSSLYLNPIQLNQSAIIKAISYKNGQSSQIMTYYYYKIPQPPTASLASGWYSQAQSTTLNSTTPNSTVKYTLDDSTPGLESGQTYNGETITINSITTLKAVSTIQTFFGVNIESPHPYSNNSSMPWTISGPSGTTKIRAHFVRIATQSAGDSIITSPGDSWSGNYADVWSSWQTGNSMTVTLVSDGSSTDYGFIIDKVEYVSSSNVSSTTNLSYGIIMPPTSDTANDTTFNNDTVVHLSNNNTGTIYYTTNGTDPSLSTNSARGEYNPNAGITITQDTTIKAVTYNSTGIRYSNVVSFNYYLLKAPTFSLPDGLYNEGTSVTISVNNASAEIYYSSNSWVDLTQSSSYRIRYTSPVLLNSPGTLYARAYQNGRWTSVSTFTYNVLLKPYINYYPWPNYSSGWSASNGSNITSDVTVKVYLYSSTTGSSTKYTLDGSDPITNGTTYLTPFFISSNTTLKAVTILNGQASAVSTFNFTIYNIYPPTASPNGGVFYQYVDVALSATGDSSNKIYYTLDWGDTTNDDSYTPTNTTQRILYTGPIRLAIDSSDANAFKEVKIKALTYNQTFNRQSSVQTFNFALTLNNSGHILRIPQPSVPPGEYDLPQYITFTTITGAKVYYTLNGDSPTLDGTQPNLSNSNVKLYTPGSSSSIYLNGFTTIKAYAYYTASDGTVYTSDIGVFDYKIYNLYYVNASPNYWNGPYKDSVTVTLTLGGGPSTQEIYYTLDGTDPVTSNTKIKYNGSFTISYNTQTYQSLNSGIKTIRIKAQTYNPTYSRFSQNSSIMDYKLFSYVNTVNATPETTGFSAPISVTLSHTSTDAQIYYTTNGTDPKLSTNTDRKLYNSAAPISISTTTTIKAAAYVNGIYGTVTTYMYKYVDPPHANPGAGTYNSPQSVGLNSSSGGTIYYTIDGSSPSTSSTTYLESLNIDSSKTVKAVAVVTDTNTTVTPYVVESPHPYTDRFDNTWTIQKVGASKLRVHFAYIQTESGCDPLTTSTGNNWSGVYQDVWSNWSTSDTITVNLRTDGSIVYYGFYIDAIEYATSYASDITELDYTITNLFPPESNYDSGNYKDPLSLTLTASGGGEIYYTTDGSTPTKDSFKYSSPFALSASTVLKAVTYKPEYEAYSSVATFDYMILLPPSASPVGGIFTTTPIEITLTSSDPEAVIYYTKSISVPDTSSTLYSGPITLSEPTYINAVAYKDGFYSNVATYLYNLVIPPTATPPAGDYTGSQIITLSTPTLGSSIYYTLDGSEPSAGNGILYSGPVSLNVAENQYLQKTVKAVTLISSTKNVSYVVESEHYTFGYTGNTWTVTAPEEARMMRVHFTEIALNDSNTLTTSADDSWSGRTDLTDVWSKWVDSNSLTINFTNDPEQYLRYGFYIDKIEYSTSAGVNAATSPVRSFEYNLYKMSVVANPPSGYIDSPTIVELSSETEGKIYFTLDGSEPTNSSTLYNQPVLVDRTMTIKAVLYIEAEDKYSRVSEFKYTYIDPPTASPAQGKYNVLPNVTLISSIPEARIFYTMDGSVPNNLSTPFTAPINLTQPELIRAVVYVYGKYSQPASFIYNKPVAPTASLPDGEYYDSEMVTLSTPTIGGRIFYTLDGSDPSPTNGDLYTGPIVLDKTVTLKSITVENPILGYVLNSPHPYPNNYNNTWTVNAPVGTNRMRVHFAKVELESGYDSITTSAGDAISGAATNVWSNWQSGESMTITLNSDSSNNYYGFYVDMIEFISSDLTDLRYSTISTNNYTINPIIKDANIYQRVYIPGSSSPVVETRDHEDPNLYGYNIFIDNDTMYYTIKFTTNVEIRKFTGAINFNLDDEQNVNIDLLDVIVGHFEGGTFVEDYNDRSPSIYTISGTTNSTRYNLDYNHRLDQNVTYAILLKVKLHTVDKIRTDGNNYKTLIKNGYSFNFTYRDIEKPLAPSAVYQRSFDVQTEVYKGTVKVY